jgi:hypothetical protein
MKYLWGFANQQVMANGVHKDNSADMMLDFAKELPALLKKRAGIPISPSWLHLPFSKVLKNIVDEVFNTDHKKNIMRISFYIALICTIVILIFITY